MKILERMRRWLLSPVYYRLEKVMSKIDELIDRVTVLETSLSAELQAIADELAQFGTDNPRIQGAIDRINVVISQLDAQTAALRENDPPADPEPPGEEGGEG